jgi:hypothetical protein
LVEGQAFEAELRVVGDALQMSIDGHVVYQGRDQGSGSGGWGISGNSDAPISVEYLDLSATDKSATHRHRQ